MRRVDADTFLGQSEKGLLLGVIESKGLETAENNGILRQEDQFRNRLEDCAGG